MAVALCLLVWVAGQAHAGPITDTAGLAPQGAPPSAFAWQPAPTVLQVPRADPTWPRRRWIARPGSKQLLTGLGGAAAAGLGTGWFLGLGDQLGAGDPASLMIGGGIVTVAGASLGALLSLVHPKRALQGPLQKPDVAVIIGYGGPGAAGGTAPLTLQVAAAPRLDYRQISVRVSGAISTQLGNAHDDDPVTGDVALSRHRWGVDVDPQLAVRVFRVPLEFTWQPTLRVRSEHYGYATTDASRLVRVIGLPLTVGVGWWVTARDRLVIQLGPQWNTLFLNGKKVSTYLGPLFGEVAYEIHLPRLGPLAASRVRLSYLHDKTDGVGVNVGAVVGFAGPFVVRYDVRLDHPRGPLALQLGVIATVGDGGGLALSVGFARPRGRIR